jgi:protein TonB
MRYVTPSPVTTAMPRAPITSARSALGAPPLETVAPPLLDLPITAPTYEIGGAIDALGAWPASPSPSGAGASTGGSDGGNPAPSEFAAWQVEKAAMAVPGTATPRYPDLLRSSGVEGEAVVTFVVDTTGAADVSTFRVLHATHELFALAVRSALPRMRFVPAEVGGRKVRQIVQQPFVFAVQR